ncbi:MAG TPA: YceI family protein [Gemmatimonadaceae bacterium]|nr:YceI family protein [Gemmatimonadaceae bacterium]
MHTVTRTLGLAMVVAAAVTAGAQGSTRVAVTPASKLWIEGTSNVHDWKCEATPFDADIEIDGGGLSTAPARLVKSVGVKVPVKALKCGHGKMDENVQKALKADKNPDISYKLTTVEALPGTGKDDFILRTVGVLTMAGGETKVNMDVNATRLADGTIKATGTVPVKMTSVGVKPPTAMLGTIRCGDEVKVKFELMVGPKVVAAIDR